MFGRFRYMLFEDAAEWDNGAPCQCPARTNSLEAGRVLPSGLHKGGTRFGTRRAREA